jgi:membrane-bound lytic murein transglycosylase D
MPKTAKSYGLENKGRKNFTASTDAALHLLSALHQQWGNWTLTFAAYNAGNTRVKYALNHHFGAQGISDLDLPLETKYYITKLKILYQSMNKLSTSKSKIF